MRMDKIAKELVFIARELESGSRSARVNPAVEKASKKAISNFIKSNVDMDDLLGEVVDVVEDMDTGGKDPNDVAWDIIDGFTAHLKRYGISV